MKKAVVITLGVLALLLGAGAGWYWWQRQARAVPVAAVAPPAAVAPQAVPPAAPAASEPRIRHPIEAPAEPKPAGPRDVATVLTDLVGKKAALSMLQLDDFPRRFVATVDNLGGARAPARLWPVVPAAGRFGVERRDDVESIAAGNADRYAAFLAFVESVEPRRAASVYRTLYPEFQQAYEELGYPGRYFNDRLVEVIDLLLATPEPAVAPRVHLPPINGPVRPERPWVLYEFDDPALDRLASGQKMLLRMGPAAERRLKARLLEFRRLIAGGKSAR
ncbi:MAG: DUF3014 domain-containing protein [Caldimonas sp.]